MIAQLAQNDGEEVARVQIVGIGGEAALNVVERGGPVLLFRIALGEREVCRSAPGGVPRGFVKGVVCLLMAAFVAEREAEIVIGLAIARVGIERGEPRDRGLEVLGGLNELSAAKIP